MQTVFQPSHGHVQMNCEYLCPVTRQWVSSWKQRKEIFAKHNLRDGSDWNVKKEIAKANKRRDETAALARAMPGRYEEVYKR